MIYAQKKANEAHASCCCRNTEPLSGAACPRRRLGRKLQQPLRQQLSRRDAARHMRGGEKSQRSASAPGILCPEIDSHWRRGRRSRPRAAALGHALYATRRLFAKRQRRHAILAFAPPDVLMFYTPVTIRAATRVFEVAMFEAHKHEYAAAPRMLGMSAALRRGVAAACCAFAAEDYPSSLIFTACALERVSADNAAPVVSPVKSRVYATRQVL